MSTPLERFPEGDGVVLVSTEVLNRLVDRINALSTMVVSPQGVGSLKLSDHNSVLDLTPLEPAQQAAALQRLADSYKLTLAALRNIQGAAVCNDDGTITFTITIPGLPLA